MTRLCAFKPKGLGGRACGEPLRDLGRDSKGVRLLACVECRRIYEVRKRVPSAVVLYDRDAEGPDQ